MSKPNVLWLLALLSISLTGMAEDHQHHQPVVDSREAIILTAEERAVVLAEMRQFLLSVQSITSALARDDMKTVAASAKISGMQAAHEIPAALRAKMPLGFRQQGMATHQAFDQMAMDAESLSDPKHSLTQTGSLLGSCVACHGQFRLESATGYKK